MKINLSLLGTATALALSATAATAAGPNLVQNGSFETTTLTHSGKITNSNLPGWQVSTPTAASPQENKFTSVFFPGQSGTVGSVIPGFDNWTFWTGATTSPDGGNFAAMQGTDKYNGTLSQTVTGLKIGQTYDLSFYFAAAEDTFAVPAPQHESWQVTFGNSTQSSEVLQNTAEGFTGWVQEQMSFVASSTSQLLSFMAIGGPLGTPPVALLDGVSLTAHTNTPPPVVTPVPEPSTWAMMLLGVGAVSLSLRSRRRKDGV